MPLETEAIAQLERLLARARSAASVDELRRNRPVCSGLEALGIATPVDFLRLVSAAPAAERSSMDLAVLRTVSHEPATCRRLRGSWLGEHLLHLISHPPIRQRISRRLVLEMNHLRDFQEERVWMGADPLAAALENGLIKVRRIASVRHYLRLADTARRLLKTEAYRFPAPPFALQQGWNWFATGADFKRLADYAPDNLMQAAESHHQSTSQGDAYLLRDPENRGWVIYRLVPNPKET
jgi:hypothetical protein